MLQGAPRSESKFIASIPDELFINNKKQINQANNMLLSFASLMGMMLFSALLWLVFFSPVDNHSIALAGYTFVVIYASMLFLYLFTFIYSITLAEKHPVFILPLFYVLFIGLFIYGIINRFFSDPIGEVFVFELVILILPILLIDRTWHLSIVEVLFLGVFIYFDLQYSKPVYGFAWREDLVNVFVCFLIGNLGGYTIRLSRIQALENRRLVVLQRDTDELTLLSNRRKLFHELRKSYDGRAAKIKCLFITDIDFFKRYNDTFGHQAGDEVLHTIGECYSHFADETGFEMFRYGGEEFIGIYRQEADSTYEDAVHLLCKKVHDLKIKRSLPDWDFITISVGFVVASKANPSGYEEFISMADAALYEAKRCGRNCSIEYTPSLAGNFSVAR